MRLIDHATHRHLVRLFRRRERVPTRLLLKLLLPVFLTIMGADFGAAQSAAYQQASVVVPQGSDCLLHAPGETDPGKSLRVSVDLDGVARFYAIRATQGGAVQQLILDCIDATGQTKSYTIDLRSDDTFASRPFDPVRAKLVPRPPLAKDPLSYSVGDLIRLGYGLRPDPTESPDAYADWLAAARMPTYLMPDPSPPRPRSSLLPKRPSNRTAANVPKPNAGPTLQGILCAGNPPGCYWTGAQLSGSSGYFSNAGTFTIPPITANGLGTGNTSMSIWTGLDNVFQTIVFAGVTNGAAGYGVGVEVQLDSLGANHDQSPNSPANSNNNSNPPWSVSANDRILLQEWYCDAAGNPTAGGAYACTFAQNVSHPSYPVWSCVAASSTTCSSTWLVNTAGEGTSAEYIVENDGPQNGNTYEWPDFVGTPITVTGATAQVVKSDGATGSVTVVTDPQVTIYEDWPPTVLPLGSARLVVSLSGANVVWTEQTGCGGVGEACCANSTCSSSTSACQNGVCKACGGSGHVCCSNSTCAFSPSICKSGNVCAACGGSGQPCCASGSCTSAGHICQSGVCGAPDTLAADPSSLSVMATDGQNGSNFASTNVVASGYWASNLNGGAPTLAFSGVPHGVTVQVANDINPPTVNFSAGIGATPGVYKITIKGTIGTTTKTAVVTLTVGACQPLTCASAGWVCGSIDNGCGAHLLCGSCAAGLSCTGGSCFSCPSRTCPIPQFWNLETCRCESCPCGVLIADGHRLCAACRPQTPP